MPSGSTFSAIRPTQSLAQPTLGYLIDSGLYALLAIRLHSLPLDKTIDETEKCK
jgi:hypothetical protein